MLLSVKLELILDGLIRCGQELEVDMDERVQAAISLTLCEISTAKYQSSPMECVYFARDAFDASNGFESKRKNSQSACVE